MFGHYKVKKQRIIYSILHFFLFLSVLFSPFLLTSAAACFSFFSAFFFALRSCSLRKYSPVSSSLSTLDKGCAGGNGVYAFFSLFFRGCFLFDKFLCWNFGRNLSQFSFFNFGSFINSRLIISALMLYMGCMLFIVSTTIFLTCLRPWYGPRHETVFPCTST